MISKSELYRKLKREVGDQIFRLLSESFIDEVLHDESLRVFSEYYPLLINVMLTRNDAIPYQDYNGKVYNFKTYKLPEIAPVNPLSQQKTYEWRDIENFYLVGNDMSDVYSGGNFLLNQFFLSARADMPHTRSYYNITFEEPNIIVVDPPLQQHRNFTVTMQANHTISTLPRNMQSLFMDLFVADMKIAIYNKFKHQSGNQTYGGIEIETKIDDFADAKSDRKEIIDIFEHDFMKNPARFEVINLFNNKSRG